MPIFEYECEQCGRVLSFLVRNTADHKSPVCPKCGHAKMTRLFSRFSSVRGGQKETGTPSPGPDAGPMGAGGDMPDMSFLNGVDENDPRSMGRAMRKMAEQTGEVMPPEMDEMCRRLESGEDPEKIEESMGDLLGDEAGGGPGGGASDNTLYDG